MVLRVIGTEGKYIGVSFVAKRGVKTVTDLVIKAELTDPTTLTVSVDYDVSVTSLDALDDDEFHSIVKQFFTHIAQKELD